VTDKPIKYVLLTHYHAVRVLGASAYKEAEILASDATRALIAERGKQDMDSEVGRFPRLFRAMDGIPGLTWPTMTFPDQISVWLGRREVRILHIGRGHTAGDVIAVVPDAGVVFSGDLVEYKSACYCGDAHFSDWLATLDNLAEMQAVTLVPGRGAALTTPEMVAEGIALTGDFLSTLYGSVQDSVVKGRSLKDAFDFVRLAMDPKFKTFAIYEHCLPFNVVRAYDEARGIERPVIWTRGCLGAIPTVAHENARFGVDLRARLTCQAVRSRWCQSQGGNAMAGNLNRLFIPALGPLYEKLDPYALPILR